jgi:hypothetical protein
VRAIGSSMAWHLPLSNTEIGFAAAHATLP